MVFKQIIILLVISTVLGLGLNLFSPNRIPYIGQYRVLSSGNGPVIPPTADAGDPPFIAIDVAEMEHTLGKAIFIDSRENEEFICGTIPRSINIEFDYLPEENVEQFVDSVLGYVSKKTSIIIFCSGEECDLSLHLARNMQDFGYTDLSIFFGGSREWEKYGLEVERRKKCVE